MIDHIRNVGRGGLLAFAFLALALSFGAGMSARPAQAQNAATAASYITDPVIADCVEELIEASQSAHSAKAAVAINAGREQAAQFSQSRRSGFLWDIGSKYCLTSYQSWYDAIRSLISGFDVWGMLITAVESILSSLLSRVCGMVVSYVNSLLESICIPFPEFSLPGLPGWSGGSSSFCNGISAADAIGLRARSVPSALVPNLPTATELFEQSPMAREIQTFSIMP